MATSKPFVERAESHALRKELDSFITWASSDECSQRLKVLYLALVLSVSAMPVPLYIPDRRVIASRSVRLGGSGKADTEGTLFLFHDLILVTANAQFVCCWNYADVHCSTSSDNADRLTLYGSAGEVTMVCDNAHSVLDAISQLGGHL